MKVHLIAILVSSTALLAEEPSAPRLEFPKTPDVPERFVSFEAAAAGTDYSANIDSIEAECITLLSAGDVGKKYAGIQALGKLRSIRAVDKLAGMVDFRLNVTRDGNTDPLSPYPACAALISIGSPSLKSLKKRLDAEDKDDVKQLLAETIARIEKREG